ncbi:MAG TPA: helix-turn-helix domain-containing protein, partial [Candidatus Omnitrophota bacterium]|nr:helix-turn-helix domain-containing protein [Candidatus Omnitrophota bacterium]
MKNKNTIENMALETIEGMYKAGTVDEITLKEVRAMALPELKPYAPQTITRLRRKLKLSQAALACFINTSVSTVQKWEQGAKKPSGPALKLL